MARKSYHQTLDSNIFHTIVLLADQHDSTVSCIVESLVNAAIQNDSAVNRDFIKNIENSRHAYNVRKKQ